MNKDKLKEFFDFVQERQSIWHKRFKMKEKPPWTNDLVLSKYKFCNIFRQLDKCTIYLEKQILTNPDLTDEMKFFNTVVHRFFNMPYTFEFIFEGWFRSFKDFNFKKLEKHLDSVIKHGEKIWNDAYTINQMGTKDINYRKKDKHIQVLFSLEKVIKMLKNGYFNRILEASSPEESFQYLNEIPQVGPFLAYELFCDLSYTDFFPWTDNDFVNIGPGAIDGAKILLEKEKVSTQEAVDLCYLLRNVQHKFLKGGWKDIRPDIKNGYMTLRTVEHTMCEYRKYHNLNLSEQGLLRCKRRLYHYDKSET